MRFFKNKLSIIIVASLCLVCIVSLTSCSYNSQNPQLSNPPSVNTEPSEPLIEPIDDDSSVLEDFIVVTRTNSGCLVRGELGGLYSLSLPGGTVVQEGSLLHIRHSGLILESYPMQFGGIYEINVEDKVLVENTRLQAYLEVFAELYDADSGLNEDIVYFDFTKFNNITDSEKEAFLYEVSRRYSVDCLEKTMDELLSDGDIELDYGLEDAILYTFESKDEERAGMKKFSIDVSKYHGPLAAYGFQVDFSIKDGRWVYTTGPHWIS